MIEADPAPRVTGLTGWFRWGPPRWVHQWLVLATALVLVALSSTDAGAESGTNDVGACLDSGQVWLLVVDVDGRALANQCVGSPTTGQAALLAGGMRISATRSGIICALNDSPEVCPRTFRGQFWHYFHAEAGEPYTFSDFGPSSRVPTPGAIEAWCYNAAEQRRCTPPVLSIVVNGIELNPVAEAVHLATTANEPATAETGSPAAVIATTSALGLGAVALWLWHRRNRRSV